ncbi:MAG: hypothetical protein NT005_01050, partial [Spirochaetes bacterium]|nr:hypothetical protein [Spirochaetota bacterium]
MIEQGDLARVACRVIALDPNLSVSDDVHGVAEIILVEDDVPFRESMLSDIGGDGLDLIRRQRAEKIHLAELSDHAPEFLLFDGCDMGQER